ncbi:hypothetical protein STEG23_017068 [Scotinomys teguina]
MQSAMFLAVQHDCVPMDKSACNGPKVEEKREKMKRTLLKDWKTRLSYFLQNSSTPGKPKSGKKSKQQTFIKPSPEEALLWAEAFDELLASKWSSLQGCVVCPLRVQSSGLCRVSSQGPVFRVVSCVLSGSSLQGCVVCPLRVQSSGLCRVSSQGPVFRVVSCVLSGSSLQVRFLVLSDGLAAFRAFLKSEFCEENIEFWLACEDFKKTKSPQKLSSKARKIYTDFIEKEAPKEVRKCYSCRHSLDIFNTADLSMSCHITLITPIMPPLANVCFRSFQDISSVFFQDKLQLSTLIKDEDAIFLKQKTVTEIASQNAKDIDHGPNHN